MTTMREIIDTVSQGFGARLMEASEHPAVLYHYAPKSERESIQRHGILRSKSEAHQVAIEELGFTDDDGPFGGIFFASKLTNQTSKALTHGEST